jgi:molybdenum cofactor cytidylyltransferase
VLSPLFYNNFVITCILLSAGSSERFGSPKALARLYGTTVIDHIQKTLLQSSCDEIIIVLGDHADLIMPSIFNHKRIHVVHNKQYYFGQTSSVQEGWRQADNSSEAVLFLPVDCPLVQPSTINTLLDHFKKNAPDILIPTYLDKKGHPPIFHQRLKTKALGLPKNLGLNSLFTEHPPQTMEINDPGIIKSFNTPEEFEKIIRKE